MTREALEDIIREEMASPASEAVQTIAVAAREQHPGTLAVLFYGSCLRSGTDDGGLVDLYLLVESYGRAHRNPLSALGNRLLPPNVYYIETPFEGRTVRAKYATVTLAQLERQVTPSAYHPYFWARFAQPTGLLWSKDEATSLRVQALLERAVRTLAREARPLLGSKPSATDLFVRALSETDQTELRAEGASPAAQLVAHYETRYRRLGSLLLADLPTASPGEEVRARRRWRGRRLVGKLLSVARLTKAAFTFAGGQGYLLWKIERHSGVRVEPRAWEQRHPLLSAPFLAWRLYRSGGFR